MKLLHVLNLAAAIACLFISLNLLLYGSIKIVEPNIYIVAAEMILATVTIALNIKEVIRRE